MGDRLFDAGTGSQLLPEHRTQALPIWMRTESSCGGMYGGHCLDILEVTLCSLLSELYHDASVYGN